MSCHWLRRIFDFLRATLSGVEMQAGIQHREELKLMLQRITYQSCIAFDA
jgi:hypothetical protein